MTPEIQALLESFQPTFDNPLYFQQGVSVSGFGYICHVNPARCVTDYTAALLAFVFAEFNPKVVQGPAIGAFTDVLGGGWSLNQKVPWFLFPDGTTINVADVAGYFCHGVPVSVALSNAKWEITEDQKAHAASDALLPPLPPPPTPVPGR